MRILVEDSSCTAEFYASRGYQALLFHLLFLSFPLPFQFSSSVYSTSLKYYHSSSLSSSKCSALYKCYCYEMYRLEYHTVTGYRMLLTERA